MPLLPGGPAPYAPPHGIITLIDGYRQRGFSTPFSTDVLSRAGVPDSLVNRTLQSLRLLDLIQEDGQPTDQFLAMKAARGDDEFRSVLRSWLADVFADVLQYADPTTDSLTKVTEAFRGYTPEGQRARMVTLMIGLFEYAGLVVSAPAKRESRPAPGRRVPSSPTTKAQNLRESSQPSSSNPAVHAPPSAPGLPPQLLGLLQAIPTEGASWTQQRRDHFVRAFESVLDFSVPIREEEVKVT